MNGLQCACGGVVRFTGTALTSMPMKYEYRCHECGVTRVLTEEEAMFTGCREEMRAEGGVYPKSCPTCGFGPCQNGIGEVHTDYTGVWRHEKTGGLYQVVCQAENESDLKPLVVYQSLNDKRIWARPKEQFDDGRFVKVSIL